MRRRLAFRSYPLARLLLCLFLLSQSSMASAAPANALAAASVATRGAYTRANSAATNPDQPAIKPTSAPEARCAPNPCALYLPWIAIEASAEQPATPTEPATTPTPLPATPTPLPATPTPLPVTPTEPATTPTQPAATPTQPPGTATAQPSPTPTEPSTPAPASDIEPPSAPANLYVIGKTDTAIALAWDASSDNVGVAGYTVYSGAAIVRITTATTTTIDGLAPSTTYTLAVTAHDAAGNMSAPSASIAITTKAPRNPGDDFYEPDNSGDQASPFVLGETQQHAISVPSDQDWVVFRAAAGWTYRIETSDLASGVDTYLELYDRDGTTLLAANDDTNGSLASLIVHSLHAAGFYYVKVRHYSSSRGNPNYTYNLRITSLDTQAPTTPRNLRVTGRTDRTVSLAWDAAADNVAVTEYALYSSSTLVLTTAGLGASVSALSASTTYTFTVAARDAAGNLSPKSATLAVTTDDLYEPDNSF
ncbi:MAG TPA: fibronectin type III domain-containing protein, partial [Roseiflexaceae bacterium]|nr:fibronectin type III domain-containing protein [Roseiflexaceae bacterium]